MNIANSDKSCKCEYCAGETDRQYVDRDGKSEGGEDQSETSDESGEDDDSNEDEDNVDVENRDDQSDIYN